MMPRWQYLSLLTASICTAVLVVVSVSYAISRPPPFSFSAGEYIARMPLLCPGEPLEYVETRIVNRSRVTVAIYHTIWSYDKDRTVIPDPTPEGYVWTEPRVIHNDIAYRVPYLPPGRYALHVGALGLSGDAYHVDFSVPESCEDIEE